MSRNSIQPYYYCCEADVAVVAVAVAVDDVTVVAVIAVVAVDDVAGVVVAKPLKLEPQPGN